MCKYGIEKEEICTFYYKVGPGTLCLERMFNMERLKKKTNDSCSF